MGSPPPHLLLLLPLLLLFPLHSSAIDPRKLFLVKPDPIIVNYHNGSLLSGNYTVNLLWYGRFSPSQHAIVADFIRSLSSSSTPPPSPSSWWNTTSYYASHGGPQISLGRQIRDENLSLGKSLNDSALLHLASLMAPHRQSITAVITSPDVLVDRFCLSRCGFHDSAKAGRHGKARYTYLWVGNPSTQCPGECAWPFHQPTYGPQTAPLVSPNGDVGMDGVVINLATLLAGTATNPYGDGYYQGSSEAPLEAVSSCTGIFGTGAYPGFPGNLLVDPTTGASYNAVGLAGRKYLLPAMWDPRTSQCATLV